jgi:uncharacterized protein (TIGR02118 family)
MARIVALYNTPKDPAAFDGYYETTHVRIAQKIPGLRSIELSKGQIVTPAGPSTYHRGSIRSTSDPFSRTMPCRTSY